MGGGTGTEGRSKSRRVFVRFPPWEYDWTLGQNVAVGDVRRATRQSVGEHG